ncbi:MAG: hypothetical protein KKF27_20190, partial [Gammaproteobacteria bacterium]|nr:hypothetical protein [Gammaproteobacteria bacterium]
MATGAPDYFKRILLYGVDEDGNATACLVDKEGRIIFRAVTTVETSTQGGNPIIAAAGWGSIFDGSASPLVAPPTLANSKLA